MNWLLPPLIGASLLAACAPAPAPSVPTPGSDPAFALKNDEPFNRADTVAIAMRARRSARDEPGRMPW